jgi:hypothetical protein
LRGVRFARATQPRTLPPNLWPFVLAVLGLLTRLPFVSRVLYHWDSINYAFALQEYSIALHQPQPPGYILYVLLIRAVNRFVGDPQWTQVGLNVLFSTLAAIALYYLGRAAFGARAGAAASLLLLFSPLFWFYSEIALPNVVDGFAVALIAWLLYHVERGDERFVFPAAAALGIVGGFRQQTLVFMAPLAVYAMRRIGVWKAALAAACTGALFAASFATMASWSGGLARYRELVANLSTTHFGATSVFQGAGWQGVLRNVGKWGSFILYALSLAVVPMAVWAGRRRGHYWAVLRDPRARFLAVWILPSLSFYTLVHMGGHGLVFTFLPALVLIAAAALFDLAAGARTHLLLGASLGVILFADVLLFAVVPNHPIEGTDLTIVNWETIRENDLYFGARYGLVRNAFDPERTLVLAETWRHAQYYIPEYHVLSLPPEPPAAAGHLIAAHDGAYWGVGEGGLGTALPAHTRVLVLFDWPCPSPAGVAGGRIEQLSAEGQSLAYVRLDESETLDYAGGELRIVKE